MEVMSSMNLTNHFLIAMPNLHDPNFSRTVTYICAHNEDGAMGITINRPSDVNLPEILEQMDLAIQCQQVQNMPVFLGGPVQTDRGFILHRDNVEWDSTLLISDTLGMTTSRDILKAIAAGDGPNNVLIALGYAGWSSGQLEEELIQNAWLNGPANEDIIFNTPIEQRWQQAALLLGVEIDTISTDIGHA